MDSTKSAKVSHVVMNAACRLGLACLSLATEKRSVPPTACLTSLLICCNYDDSKIGDCDNDSDCQGDLVCYQSDASDGVVPGCSGVTSGTTDYCFTPTIHSGNLLLTFIGNGLSAYGECEGDCDSDSEVSGVCRYFSWLLTVTSFCFPLYMYSDCSKVCLYLLCHAHVM